MENLEMLVSCWGNLMLELVSVSSDTPFDFLESRILGRASDDWDLASSGHAKLETLQVTFESKYLYAISLQYGTGSPL